MVVFVVSNNKNKQNSKTKTTHDSLTFESENIHVKQLKTNQTGFQNQRLKTTSRQTTLTTRTN